LVETLEHRRFIEFCDACRRYAYIGLCYGSPGVGKTLSARSYSRWDKVKQSERWIPAPADGPPLDTVFYTPPVVNAPKGIEAEIKRSRDILRDVAKRPLRYERDEKLDAVRLRDEEHQAEALYTHDWLTGPIPELHPTYGAIAKDYGEKERAIGDPTTLILVDEADRLRMASLEQVRSIFDAGEVGLILIGMPGLEKTRGTLPSVLFAHRLCP
jgi:hypothetical protein